MPSSTSYQTLTIANGASLSGVLMIPEEVTGLVICMPSAWTTANLTFQGSYDNSTYGNVYDDVGQEVVVQAAASRNIIIDFNLPALLSFQYLKIRSGTAASAVNQGADRSIVVILKR